MIANTVDDNTIYILDNNGAINWRIIVDDDFNTIIKAIIERRGFYRSLNSKDAGRGRYMTGTSINKILKENPDWIKTKATSMKFGI